jgi:RNA polymerase sigma-70 factor, ECF subfamily
MEMVEPRNAKPENSSLLKTALAGDEGAFAALTEGYRRELQVHCYRMVGSFEDAEDLLQDTLLRAWKNRSGFEGRSSFRTWLYRIATNACLDFLNRREHRVIVAATDHREPLEVPWLQPFPDRLLEPAASAEREPDARAVTKETIELAYLRALQVLSPKQRAAVILCDVLDWSAREVAGLLETTAMSVHAALRRARATLSRHQGRGADERAPGENPTEQERALLRRYVDATERGDAAGLAALLRDDVRFAMPPEPGVWVGRDVVVQGWVEGGFGSPSFGDFRCIVTRANRLPAVANYVRKPGATDYRFLALDVLTIEGGLIRDVSAFSFDGLTEAFELPRVL